MHGKNYNGEASAYSEKSVIVKFDLDLKFFLSSFFTESKLILESLQSDVINISVRTKKSLGRDEGRRQG